MWLNIFILGITVLLSACATTSHTDPEPKLGADVPTHWHNASAIQTKTPDVAWWLALNDPVLNEAMALALKQNLTVAQVAEKLTAARAVERATIANQYPRIGFSVGPDSLARPLPEAVGTESSASAESPFRTTGAYLAGFDMNWELQLFGRGTGQRKIAKSSIDSAEAELSQARISINAEVVRVYGNLRAAQGRIRLLDTMLVRNQALDDLMAQGLQAGVASFPEREASRNALEKMRTAQEVAIAQRESTLYRLAVLCGLTRPLPVWMKVADTSWKFTHVQTSGASVPANIISARPDVHHAEAAVLKASGEVGVARADLYPKLSIEGALMVAGNLAGAARAVQTITLLAPAIRIPLVDWGLTREVVNAREAKLREAILAYREAVLLAIEETEVAFANFNAADARLVQDEQSAKRLDVATGHIQLAFDAGYLSRVDSLKEAIKIEEQKLQHIDDAAEWFTAYAAVNKAQATMPPEPMPKTQLSGHWWNF